MKKTANLETGINIKFDSNENIKKLVSPYDNNVPTNGTILESEVNGIFGSKQKEQINDLFKSFGEIFRPNQL